MTDTANYKELLLKARKLRGKAGENAHARAELLVAVFEDADFRADVGAADDWKAAEMLDAEIEDLCLSFLELREMLKAFPDRKDWRDGRLKTLYEKTKEKPAAENSTERPKRAVNRVTIDQFKAEESARKEAEARLSHQQRECDRLAGELQAARDECQQLRGRILELERLLKRDVQTV